MSSTGFALSVLVSKKEGKAKTANVKLVWIGFYSQEASHDRPIIFNHVMNRLGVWALLFAIIFSNAINL